MVREYLKKVLLELPSEKGTDMWTVDDAMKGIAILGGTGSGKTSASGKTIALKFLREGWGGIVLCAKTGEADLWKDYCKEANRTNDLIVFSKGAVHQDEEFKGQQIVFNPIDYEMKREGDGAGETHNITNIFMNIYRMGNRIAGEGDTKEERFWDSALKRCINRIVELIKLSGEDLTFKNMVRILAFDDEIDTNQIVDAANYLESGGENEEEDTINLDSDSNYCLYCLAKAFLNLSSIDEKDERLIELESAYSLVYNYFANEFNALGGRTKSTIKESFMGLAEPFLSGLLSRHFSGKTNIFPEWTYKKHKIIVLDFSIKEYLDAGIISQCVFKMMFQQAIERRKVSDYPVPVFLWADEAQYFINPYDQIFLTTARSSLTSTVYLTQNISNYLSVLGSGSDSKAKVDSLLGNLCTKIFHANTDAETNEYASRLIGSDLIMIETYGSTAQALSLNDSRNKGMAPQFLPQIFPKEFTELKTGGDENQFEVQAIFMVSGKVWKDKKNFRRVTFKQNFQN